MDERSFVGWAKFVEYVSIIPEWGFDIDTPEDYNDLQHRESEGV